VYSSGTTGVPKCIVHSVGGVLIGIAKEGKLHRELGPESIVLQYTTVGSAFLSPGPYDHLCLNESIVTDQVVGTDRVDNVPRKYPMLVSRRTFYLIRRFTLRPITESVSIYCRPARRNGLWDITPVSTGAGKEESGPSETV